MFKINISYFKRISKFKREYKLLLINWLNKFEDKAKLKALHFME